MVCKPTLIIQLIISTRMKKLLFILCFAVFFSCETKTVEINKESCFDYGIDAKYILGSDDDAQMAVDLVLAFADKDSETMVGFMGDTVRYMPPQGGKMITTLKPEIHDVVKMLHEPYDSIKRTVWNAVPLKSTKRNFTRVTVAFKEDRFYKDGSQETVGLVDRIFISADERKIFRIHQWMMEME